MTNDKLPFFLMESISSSDITPQKCRTNIHSLIVTTGTVMTDEDAHSRWRL